MAIGQVVLDDFTGGQRDARAAQDFEPVEWSRLFGVVIEEDRTVRAQWAVQLLEARPVLDFGAFDGTGAFLVDTDTGPVWFGGGLPLDQDRFARLDGESFAEGVLRLGDDTTGRLGTGLLGGRLTQ